MNLPISFWILYNAETYDVSHGNDEPHWPLTHCFQFSRLVDTVLSLSFCGCCSLHNLTQIIVEVGVFWISVSGDQVFCVGTRYVKLLLWSFGDFYFYSALFCVIFLCILSMQNSLHKLFPWLCLLLVSVSRCIIHIVWNLMPCVSGMTWS